MSQPREELPDGAHADALSIAELYGEIEGALSRAFPRPGAVWVRGEIQSLSDRTGHCYIDLVDPECARDRQAPVLKVKCWRKTWGRVTGTLQREGLALQPGMVVALRGSVDFYRPRAEVGFILDEIDVAALLGRLAAKRAALIRALRAEGLLERNRAVEVPEVPVHVGLVGSPGTEGFRDFVGQLTGSGFAFHVTVAPVTVQGPGAPMAVAAALSTLPGSACELAVVVRGGGSKADLGAFDAEPVARAIATSPLPVWTGIGHTGDEAVADIVANRSFITPTECGREVAAMVTAWWEERSSGADAIIRRAHEVVADAANRDEAARHRLVGNARQQFRAHEERLRRRVSVVTRLGPLVLDDAGKVLGEKSGRVTPLARNHVARALDRVETWRRLMAAYNVERQLERGYTLTLDPQGTVVRSVAAARVGAELVTRFADGAVRSRVESPA